MARRRQQEEAPAIRAEWLTHDPAEAVLLLLPGEPLPCDRSEWLPERPCSVTASQHDEWCAVFAVRRDFYRRTA